MLEKLVSSRYEKIVAAETHDDGTAVLFIRDGDKVSQEKIAFEPFILLDNPALLQGLQHKFELDALKGPGRFSTRARFQNVKAYEAALKFLKENTGFTPSAPNAPYRIFSDLGQQLLMGQEFRLFRGMAFHELRRLHFDIETLVTPGYEFPNPKRDADMIVIISLADNSGWEKVISADGRSEKELLEEFVKLVRERDPDTLEGHNIFRFDLPFIEERAKRHKVRLALGRDGSALSKRNSRVSIAERTVNYTRYEAYGRHVVDSFHLVQFYDISHRELEGYGLKYVARHFGVAAKNRTYVEGADIARLWEEDRAKLLAYALDDAREARAVSAILSPSYFYQAQLIPMSYQDCVVRGNATRIDAMLVAAYLAEGGAPSEPEASRPFSGALTEAFAAGVFKNVWHCDVRSLYPSIILAEKWCPKRDVLGVFPRFLDSLRRFRLDAKDAQRAARTSEEKDYFNSLQTTFKILINSFYGYLGFSQGTFNDYDMAESVTSRGREILTLMLETLRKSGANVIEMDTDGIYFQPPPGMDDAKKMGSLIQAALPEGIEVELDEQYPAMFCYKSKNYALLSSNGEVAITGAALKSRGLEPFQRDYISAALELLLKGHATELKALSSSYRRDIGSRAWPLARLAKSETLNDSPETYRKKMASGEGRRSAAYELALNSARDYRQGDQISFYITGTKKKVSVVDNSRLLADAPPQRDENIDYYLSKLDELESRFAEFIPPAKAEEEFKLES
ncbi:MAG: hypothetical protein A2X49_17340 [Lentisphaerae bacterium GWF2_52_8]|nr:MAG: hypothetical protein A2X49_17340 [Lentisphaerae bacterium GWF2_52_8]